MFWIEYILKWRRKFEELGQLQRRKKASYNIKYSEFKAEHSTIIITILSEFPKKVTL